MDRTSAVLVTLVAYKLLLVGIGIWASRRSGSEGDFFLGGRALGPWVAAISYSSSASSAWTLLGISGVAYLIGVSALWIVLGTVVGMLVAWYWIAPRLRTFSREHNHLTVTDFLLHGSSGTVRTVLAWSVSLIIVVSFVFYVAAQFQGAGNTFAATFDLSMRASIVLGASIVMVYTLLGGFWAVSVTDTIQGLLMAATALVLPVVAVLACGGVDGFLAGLRAVSTPAQLSLSGGNAGLVAAGIVLGGLAVGAVNTYGQPHLLVRFMALRDARALRQARLITLFWYLVVFGGMALLGLAGHVLHPGLANPETVFFVLSESLFPTLLGAVLLAAVLSAIMSTADSQLLVAASAVAHDLGLDRRFPRQAMLVSRLSVAGVVVLAVVVALYLPERIFDRVLFAWVALGSAFGPLVFVRLAGRTVAGPRSLASVWTGFALAVGLSLAPSTPGDIAERVLPFLAALAILLPGSRPRVSAGPPGAD